ncbi:MAG: Ig-like domain-containing protein [Pseudomonadota bacterium]
MSNFEQLLADQADAAQAKSENLVKNGDFSTHTLEDGKKWGTMDATGGNSWFADSGKIEVQRATVKNGTPAQREETNVLELDARGGKHGGSEKNAVVSQTIEAIDGPGTFRISIDHKAMNGKKGVSAEDTSGAEIWLGDKLVATLSEDNTRWHQEVIEVTLDADDLPTDGPVKFTLKALGQADGRGTQVDNISVREVGETGLLGEELITNGSFESHGEKQRDKWGTFEQIEGWEVENDSVIEIKEVRKPISPRDQNDTYIELDSHGKNSNATVSQEIDVPEAGKYLLSFDLSARAKKGLDDLASTNGVKVMVGDQVVAELAPNEVGWEPYTFNVDLPAGAVTLSFEGTGTEDKIGALLDNIALKHVGAADPAPVVVLDVAAAAEAIDTYESGLMGEVFFSDEVLTRLDQAISEMDDTPDATFVATEIDYGNNTGWFHTPLSTVLEHDAGSLEGSEEALSTNVNHTAMKLTGEVYLEAGTHTFHNRTDDGFRLTIDDQEIAEYEGLRAARNTEGSITVAEDGWYDITVDYFDWKGHSKLRITHEHDGNSQILSEDRLRHEVEEPVPVAADDLAVTDEDTAITLDLLSNDTGGEALSITGLGPVENGELVLNEDGTVTFTPAENFHGDVSFEYTISDGTVESTATASVTVAPVNDDPDAIDDEAEGLEDEAIEIDVLGNDTDVDGDQLFVIDATDGANGTVTFLPPTIEIESAGEVTLGDNLIDNGDFEDNPLAGRLGWATYEEINGWTSPVGKIEVQTRDYSTGNTVGNTVVELDSHGRNSNATLRQEVDVPESGLYQFSLDYALRGHNVASNGVGVRINGETVTEVYPDTRGFQTLTVDLELDAGDAVIEIYALGREDTIGTVIDNAALRPISVGEPVRTITAPDGTLITYTPDPGFHGTDTFTYTITDGNGGTDTATVTVYVAPSNAAPSATDDVINTDEDRSVTVDLLANDTDPDGDTLTITSVGEVETGELVLNEDGTVSFTPDADFHGEVSFTYEITDGELTSTAIATVVVAPINDAPIANDDTFDTDEDRSVTMDLLANDTDPDGDTLTITSVGEVENGELVLNEDGTVTFTPDADFHGEVSFTYEITDGELTSTATATVVVAPINDAPIAKDDTFDTDEDRSVTVDLLTNDTDPDGDTLTITSVGEVENGELVLNEDGTVTFTPDADFHGEVSFTYEITDGELTSTATATIVVAEVNDGPVAQDDQSASVAGEAITIDLLGNDSDSEGDALSIVSFSGTGDHTVEDNGDGTITFTSSPEADGTVTFSYTIDDGRGGRDTATVTVAVQAANKAPEAANDTATVQENGSVIIDLLANDTDPDGDALSIASLGTVENGALVDNGDGTVTFTPDADFFGEVTFDYTTTDGELTDDATVRIVVTSTNVPPVATDDVVTLDEDTSINFDVLANDFDPDGDPITVAYVGSTVNGEVTLEDDGTITFTPDEDYFGTFSLTYRVSDLEGDRTTGTVEITVSPVSDAPTTRDDERAVNRDSTTLINVMSNDRDPDRGELELVSVSTDLGEASIVDGRVFFDPGSDFDTVALGSSADATVTYTIRNEAGLEATGTLIVTVNAPFSDRVQEEIDFILRGDNGTRTEIDGENADLLVADQALDGNDNRDELRFDLFASGGNGRNGELGETGSNNNDGDAEHGTSGTEGGIGADAFATLLDGAISGFESDDEIQIEVTADGGRGGSGGDGGRGGRSDSFGTAVTEFANGNVVTKELEGGIGGDGANGAGGRDGGDAFSTLDGGIYDGGEGADQIEFVIEAFGGDGGDGGNGGRSGNGAFEDPYVGGGVNPAISGDGADGAAGGDATAEMVGADVIGGDGDDTILIEVVAQGGDAGSAGNGGASSSLQFQDTLRVVNGDGTADDNFGYIERQYGDAGNGGNGGDAGSAVARIADLIIDSGIGNDIVTLDATATAGSTELGGSAGNPGEDSELTGDLTVVDHAGTPGLDGLDGMAGNAAVEIMGNVIETGDGDDTVILRAVAEGDGGTEVDLVGNSVRGGEGIDTLDLSGIGVAVTVDLAAGTFGTSEAPTNNTVVEVEAVTGSAMGDILRGSGAAETIEGGTGDDEMSGGGGSDIFVFANGSGDDVITDFSADRLDVAELTRVRDMSDITITQTGSDTTISFDGEGSVVLVGVTATSIDEATFIF